MAPFCFAAEGCGRPGYGSTYTYIPFSELAAKLKSTLDEVLTILAVVKATLEDIENIIICSENEVRMLYHTVKSRVARGGGGGKKSKPSFRG